MFNLVVLTGRLTADPELKTTPNGISVTTFSIAVNRNYSSSDGERQTDFFNITVWRTQAENCGRYLKKGSKVAIVGSLQNRTYEDKDGNKRTVTDIVANEVEFLSSKGAGEGQEEEPRPMSSGSKKPELEVMADDDQLPF
jgi:single-strand DNA-binding protein